MHTQHRRGRDGCRHDQSIDSHAWSARGLLLLLLLLPLLSCESKEILAGDIMGMPAAGRIVGGDRSLFASLVEHASSFHSRPETAGKVALAIRWAARQPTKKPHGVTTLSRERKERGNRPTHPSITDSWGRVPCRAVSDRFPLRQTVQAGVSHWTRQSQTGVRGCVFLPN